MTVESQTNAPVVKAIRAGLGFAGLVALIVGLLILLWPGRTAAVGTAILAIYMILEALTYAAVGLFSKTRGAWARIGHVLLAVLFLAAGISVFANLAASTAFLAVFLAVTVGILWIAEGAVALAAVGASTSKALTVFFAVLSIVAGVVVISSPLWSAVLLWWLVGISFVILGIAQIVRAISLRVGSDAS